MEQSINNFFKIKQNFRGVVAMKRF